MLKGGDDLKEAFEQAAVAMFGYMTEIETVNIYAKEEIQVEADDLDSLLYKFLDEFLFLFCVEPFFISRVRKVDYWFWQSIHSIVFVMLMMILIVLTESENIRIW